MNASPDILAAEVAALVRIPSVNPLQAGPKAGIVGEEAVAEAVAQRLADRGASEVVVDELSPGRSNVYGFVPGHERRLAVLDVHTDTVTVEHMTDDPFDGRIEAGHVWGRGALDTKASLGVILAMLAEWARDGLRPTPTLLVVGTAGEEAGGMPGAKRFREWGEGRGLEIDEMIVSEPTQMTPIHGHKGGVIIRATVHGRSAHSALPQLGENAIDAMAPVIEALKREHLRLQSLTPRTLLGNGTLSTATITGGTAGNVIPDLCVLTAGRRIVPEEDSTAEFERLREIVRDACPLPVDVVSSIPPDADGRVGSAAFYVDPDSPFVQRLAAFSGNAPKVAPFGTNAFKYGGWVTQVAVLGPGSIDDAHQATECVAIDDLGRLATFYERWLQPH